MALRRGPARMTPKADEPSKRRMNAGRDQGGLIDEHHEMNVGQPRDAPVGVARNDPHAIPLETGAHEGAARGSFPLSGTDSAIAGQRGHEPVRAGGASGELERENADARQATRRDSVTGTRD